MRLAFLLSTLVGSLALVGCGGGSTRPLSAPGGDATDNIQDEVTSSPVPPASPSVPATPLPTNTKGEPFRRIWLWPGEMIGAFAWPVAAGDSVYVSLAREAICCGNEDMSPGALISLGAESGAERWRFEMPAPALRPTLVGDTVVVGTTNGMVYGVSAADGHELWSIEFPGLPALSVAAADGLVLVSDGDPELFGAHVTGDISRDAGRVWAIEAATGDIRWRSDVVGIQTFVAVAGQVAVIAVSDAAGASTIAGLDAVSGRELWRDTSGTVTTPLAVEGGTVFLAGQRLQKRDAATGRVLWSVPRSEGTLSYWPVVWDDTVVIWSQADTLEGYSVESGEKRWAATTPVLRRDIEPAPRPFIAGGRLFLQKGGIWSVTVGSSGTATVQAALIPQGAIQYLDVGANLLVYSTSIGSAPTVVLAFRP